MLVNLYQLVRCWYISVTEPFFLFSFLALTLEKKRLIHEARVVFDYNNLNRMQLEEIIRELKVSGKKTQHVYSLWKHYYSSFKVSTCSTANCRYVQSPRSSLIPLWGEKTTQHGLVSVYTNSQHHREKLQTWSSDKRPESRSVSKAGSDSLSWLMLKLDLCQLSQRVSPRQEKNVACKRSAFIIWRKSLSSFRFPPTLNTDSSFRRISSHTPADTQYLWKQYLQKTDILYRR